MKKENSAIHQDMRANIEAVPSSPTSPDTGKAGLESEVSSALQSFDYEKRVLANMERKMAEDLPEADKEDESSILRHKKDTSDVVELAGVMLRQLPHLKELEYMVTDPKSAKQIKSALNYLEGLKTKYESIESSEAVKARKVASQENINVQLRNREQIELKDQEEKARKATAVMRRDLANLKRSFYKMYGMTFNEALVLPSSPKPAEGQTPKGFWGKLADKVWEKPQNPAEKKLEAAKSKDAKTLIKRIQNLDKQVETAWNETMGQYAQESEPQTSISLETLRTVLEQEMPEKSPREIEDSANRILKSLRLAVPEDVKEVKKEVDMSNVHELKPERIEKPEPSVVIKTETPIQSRKEVPTLKVAREEKPVVKEAEKSDRKQIAIEIMKAFGGGEQARQRGSNLFEAVKNQMQLMKLEDMDPLDYVQLVAERTQAKNENDEKAAKEYDKQIQALNKKLSFGSTDPSKGINMGGSRLMEARALGSTPARAEAAKMVEQITAMHSQKAEREPVKFRKPGGYKTEEVAKENKTEKAELKPFTLDWAKDRFGKSASTLWERGSKLINNAKNGGQLVRDRIAQLIQQIEEFKKTENLKSKLNNFSDVLKITEGDPAEATMLVMLRVASFVIGNDTISKTTADSALAAIIIREVMSIEHELEEASDAVRPTLKIVKKEKPSLRLVKEELPKPEVPQKKETIPPPPEFLSTSVEYRKLADELIDKSEVPSYVPNIKGLAKLIEGGKKKSPKEMETLFYAIAEGMNLRSMAELGDKNKSKVDTETLEYIKTKEDYWLKIANGIGKKFGIDIANAQGTGFIQKGAWELKNITNEDYETLKAKSLSLKNLDTIRHEIQEAQPMDDQGVSDYLVIAQNYLETLGKEDWQTNAAERAWKELNKTLGVSHAKIKKLVVEGKK